MPNDTLTDKNIANLSFNTLTDTKTKREDENSGAFWKEVCPAARTSPYVLVSFHFCYHIHGKITTTACILGLYPVSCIIFEAVQIFLQQLQWFLHPQSCFIKWYEKERSIKRQPLCIHNGSCLKLWIYFMLN